MADDLPDASQEPSSALDVCLVGSLGIGQITALPARPPGRERRGPGLGTRASDHGSGRDRGFDLHAGVVVEAHDRAGRERLLRYCARPPLSLERLSVLRDGRVAYELRKPWGRATHRVMTPLQFLARLAALIPPPRHPLIRFHGVFAPHSSWRKTVAPEPGPCSAEVPSCAPATGESPSRRPPSAASAPIARSPCSVPAATCAPRAETGPSRAALLALRAPLPYIPWAELLRRTYDLDVLRCPCGGRLRFIAVILDGETARDILDSLGLPSTAPPVSRARSPDLIDPIPEYD